MNRLIIRTSALLLHAFLNFVLVSYLLNYDLTGSWIVVTGFIILLFLLVVLFIRHLLSYFYFIKTKTK